MRMPWNKRNNRVRVHFVDGVTTVEGILVGRVGGHYILWNPRVLNAEDEGVPVTGHVEIPESRVLFYQVLA